MRHFDAIRGRGPTKTEQILEYLVNRPNEMLTPKKVAETLRFNLQTTVTVLNRLALEGVISKKGRGQFCYEGEGKESRDERRGLHKDGSGEVAGAAEEGQPLEIDRKTAALIYKAIYNMASESMGAAVVGSVTGLSLDDFHEKAPLESIRNLVRALIDFLGEEIADDIVSIALDNELTTKERTRLKHMLVR